MDFHSLARSELQALCKTNKIPANMANVAMAAALKSLEIVEGIEEIMNPLKESVDNEKQDVLMTPAPAGVASRRRRAKEESTVQRVYGTRRSARLLEKSTKILNEVDDSEASKISKHESLTKIGCSDVKKNLKRDLDDMDEGSKMQANTRPKTRQAFSVVNGSQEQAPTSGPPSNPASECGVTEFTKEDVEALRASQEEAIKRKEALGSEVVCLRGELQQARDDRDRLLLQVQALSTEVMKYKEFTGEYVSQLDSLVAKTSQLESTCLSQSEEIQRLKEQLAFAEQKLKLSDMSNMEARSVFEEQKALVTELQNRLAEADSKFVEGEKVRKKLHNTILELKGNIRVFCRVRPLLSDDGVGSDAKVVSFPTSTEQMGRGIDLTQNEKKHSFTFDKVFMPENSQEDVFVEISQLVQSALDGYKVCIFAYGQTGSGKTYTMMGRPNQPSEKGLIPRTLEQVFETKQHLEAEGWKYEMQVSMLEIYNETIRDLLAPNRPSLDASRAENVAKQQYAIKHDAHGNTYVSDLTIVDVGSSKEVSYLLERASQSRSVSKTQMNEQSSRSHFVFTLRIMGVNEGTDQQVQGVLNLIDLAGSERLSRSDATGDRLKETQAINKSLSSLSDVIFALAKKEEHVPFRNSKLTYLLQPCLGGDSKMLMFVNLAPDPASASESLCSLRFAARVNACEIGIPRRQTSLRSIDSRLSRSQFLQSPQSVHRSLKSRSQFPPTVELSRNILTQV